MSNEFMREERYIVFKMSDLGNSLKGDEIRRLAREYAEHRQRLRKKPLECVVVEKDWPEYEATWKAIEARVTSAQNALEESAVQTAARIMNIELIRERDALRAKIAEMEKQEADCEVVGQVRNVLYEVRTLKYDLPAGTKLYALPGAQPEPESCPCCGETMRIYSRCRNADCEAVMVTPEQAKYNKVRALMKTCATRLDEPPAPSAPSEEAAAEMGANGGHVVEAERLAFEAWMRGHCWKLGAKWTGTEYRSAFEKGGMVDMHAMRTRELWAAWRDRAALAAAPEAKP